MYIALTGMQHAGKILTDKIKYVLIYKQSDNVNYMEGGNGWKKTAAVLNILSEGRINV
mgnify:CR=1 FL=1